MLYSLFISRWWNTDLPWQSSFPVSLTEVLKAHMFSALYKECFYLSHILQCYFSLYCVSNIFIFSLSIGLSSFVKSAAPSSLHFPVFVFVIGQMLQAPPLSCEHTGETSVCLLLIQLGWKVAKIRFVRSTCIMDFSCYISPVHFKRHTLCLSSCVIFCLCCSTSSSTWENWATENCFL